MKVAFDANVLNRRSAGIGRYADRLMKSLLSLEEDLDMILISGPQTEVQEWFSHSNVQLYNRWQHFQGALLRCALLLPATLRSQSFDIFHGLDHLGLPFFSKRGKFVVTVHDMAVFLYGQTFTWRHRNMVRTFQPFSLRQADRIIAVSLSTARDLVRILGIDSRKVVVIPEGVDPSFRPVRQEALLDTVRRKYGIRSPRYVLSLGTLEPRKNLDFLLKCWSRLLGVIENDYELVIAGQPGWQCRHLLTLAQSFGLTDRVVFTGYVEDEDLPALYSGATLFVYPSLYEGFGLPVLEAMACGVPVITSNNSSLAEIASHAGLLVDPKNEKTLENALIEALRDESLRKELSALGEQRARQFTWEQTARKTLALYKELV